MDLLFEKFSQACHFSSLLGVGGTESFSVWSPNILDQKGMFADWALTCLCPLWHQLYPLLEWLPASVFCMDTQKCRGHMTPSNCSHQWARDHTVRKSSYQGTVPVPAWVPEMSKHWLCFHSQFRDKLWIYKAARPKQLARSWVRKGPLVTVYSSHSHLYPSISSSYSPRVGLSHLRRQTEVHQM
jgi:hypothetical protein